MDFENISTEFSRFYGIRKMNSDGQKRIFPTRIILITIVVGIMLIAVPVLAGEKQIEKIPHTVLVGTELDYPPYSFLDKEGKPSGYNVELSQAIAKVMGLNIEIKIGPWGDIRNSLKTGKIDVISGMYYSKERAKLVNFSPPYTIVHHAIFTRQGSPEIKSEEELRGREIIVMRGDIMHDYVLEKDLSKSPVVVDTQADALRLLASGKYDYALIAKLPGLYWLKKLGLSNIVIVGPLMRPSDYCYAVKKGNTELMGRFSEGLAIIRETGQIKEIYDKWLGVLEPRGIPKETIFKYGGLSLLSILLILGGSVVWLRTLKSQVAQRTAELEKEISERKRAEEERALLIGELEGKNAELERFTYTVSHDLKSPLITIKGFLGMLEKDAIEGNTERMKADMVRISGAAEKMHRLLDELLELSRIGRLVNPPEKIPMVDLAHESLSMLAGRMGDGIEVEIAPDLPMIYGDRLRMREVLENLITNACSFMGSQTKPRIELGARQKGGETIFYVRDNGIGIDPKYHEKVFDLFDKLDQNTEGTGVGLTIVKQIVEVHGGRIWVESEGIGKGTTFCFTIPDKSELKVEEE